MRYASYDRRRPHLPRLWPIRFVEALRLFKIGYSWGGVTSLVMAYESLGRTNRNYGHHLVRLNIGLEETEDLIADLEHAVARNI